MQDTAATGLPAIYAQRDVLRIVPGPPSRVWRGTTTWVTVTDAAKALRVDSRNVRRWIEDGTLRCKVVGTRERYVDAIQVLELLETRGPVVGQFESRGP